MHTPILPSRAPKPNVIDTERNRFTINDNTKGPENLSYLAYKRLLLDRMFPRGWIDYCLPVEL